MAPRDDDDVRHGRKAKLSPSRSSTVGNVLESVQRFLHRSHAGDYIGLAIIVALWLPLKLLGEPFHQMFQLSDPRIQYPHAEVERVGISTYTHLSSKRTVH